MIRTSVSPRELVRKIMEKNYVQEFNAKNAKVMATLIQSALTKKRKSKIFTLITWDDMSESEDSHDEEGESGGDDGNFTTLSCLSTLMVAC